MRGSRAGAIGVVFAIVAALVGCDTMNQAKPALFGIGSGLNARLKGIGSAAKGNVALQQFPNYVALNLSMSGVPVGRYRIVIHSNPNCSSPNGFTAGPPWDPPGVTPPLPTQVLPFYMQNDNTTEVSVRLVGVTLEGPNSLLGRSIIIHAGAQGPLTAVPDVRNDRVACGIIGPVDALF
jgi:Cu-Zn family superoxide dismutase